MARKPILDINTETGLIGIGPLAGSAVVAAFNEEAAENLIQTKGVVAYHYRHALSPDRTSVMAGVNVINDASSNHGVLFYEVRKLKVVPYSLPVREMFQIDGVYGMGSCVLNVAGHYDDGQQEHVFISPRDIVMLNPTITTQYRQLVDITEGSFLKLKYKVKSVEYIASATQRYEQDSDFCVVDGVIVWHKAPPAGTVISIVYWFAPIYVVTNVPHSLRLLPSNDIGHGGLPRELKYAPQLVMCAQSHLSEWTGLDFLGLPEYQEI